MGVPDENAAGVIRIHMLPQVYLWHGDRTVHIVDRIRGPLTGAKTASLLAVIPVWDCAMDARATFCANAVQLPGVDEDEPTTFMNSFAVAAWADNLYSFAGSKEGHCNL
jgi:hypothetical protein